MSIDYARDTFAFVDQSHTITSLTQLNAAFGELVRKWGFERWWCARVARRTNALDDGVGLGFGEPNLSWLATYRREGFLKDDAVITSLLSAEAAIWWSEVWNAHRAAARGTRRVESAAREFGLNEGLVTPIRPFTGELWAVVMGGTDDVRSDALRDAGSVAAQFYAGRGLHLMRLEREAQNAGRLTARQREILLLLRDGHTQAEVADRLNIAVSTVANLLADARSRFDARNVVHLMAEAILHGEIDPETGKSGNGFGGIH